MVAPVVRADLRRGAHEVAYPEDNDVEMCGEAGAPSQPTPTESSRGGACGGFEGTRREDEAGDGSIKGSTAMDVSDHTESTETAQEAVPDKAPYAPADVTMGDRAECVHDRFLRNDGCAGQEVEDHAQVTTVYANVYTRRVIQ